MGRTNDSGQLQTASDNLLVTKESGVLDVRKTRKKEKKEYEKISHTHVSNINFFLINLTYRSPHLHHDFEIIQVIEGARVPFHDLFVSLI